jgi:hypothetical protein
LAKRADGSDSAAGIAGHRHGSRTRSLMGTFGKTEITVPRARLETPDGKTTEWRSSALRAYSSLGYEIGLNISEHKRGLFADH